MLKLVSPEEGSAPAAPDVPMRYWAFLSYSHHDKLIAKRLQKQLETYRVPRRLVGRETSVGVVPARVSPVFRDRDELHAGADLKASVQDALSKSRWLIVVCTPDAARSPWVNREIIEFKKLHGERRVLALIARGEPFASDMPGREAEECFPPALRRALNDQGLPEGELLEPIAADMRKQGDGPQRAMLKLLAGMVGVSFDDLVRRDMQRRVRLLSVVAGASVLGLVAFAFLAVMAVQARNEAQHQRMQAEGLIEFMLGDLRKKLEPVGRLEVLDSVGEKALAYYGAQESGKLDATALGHRSRAMHLIGEIRSLRGKPEEAQVAFEQAASTTAQLLANEPNSSQRLFDHAQSAFWVGDAAWKRGDGKTAELWLNQYLALAEKLTNIDPGNVDWRAELAFAHVNLGVVQLGMGRPKVALVSLKLAEELLAQLFPERPDLGYELAQNHGWKASAYEVLGDYERALAEQKRKLAIFRSMPGGEKNRTAQRGIFNAMEHVSRYELALGKVSEAEANTRASLELGERLIGVDPKNLLWLGDACGARLRLAEILLLQNRLADARREFAHANDCVKQVEANGALSIRYTVVLKARQLSLSPSLEADRSDKLVERMEEFLQDLAPKLKIDTTERTQLTTELANLSIAQGDLLFSRGDATAARSAWLRAEAMLRPLAEGANGSVLTPLAQARLRMGSTTDAMALASQIQVSTYRHPAYAELVKQLQAARGGGKHFVTPGARP
jgi:tetratricopeptide (TPR) repeat protein